MQKNTICCPNTQLKRLSPLIPGMHKKEETEIQSRQNEVVFDSGNFNSGNFKRWDQMMTTTTLLIGRASNRWWRGLKRQGRLILIILMMTVMIMMIMMMMMMMVLIGRASNRWWLGSKRQGRLIRLGSPCQLGQTQEKMHHCQHHHHHFDHSKKWSKMSWTNNILRMVNWGDIGGEQCIVVQFASVQSVHCSVFTSAQRRDDIDGDQ